MHKGNEVILLVEDNPDDVALTMRAFKRSLLANPVVVVRDGVEALDFLFARNAYEDRASQPLPTLVILDLKLPRLDGLGVLKAIRECEHMRFLPVVVLTSSKEEQDLVSSYTLGANSYVRKPVDFAEFVEAARVLGIYWLMMNELPPESRRHEP
jgi:CheY-like chemotaxis protein